MHKKLPKVFVFLDEYNSEIFRNKNKNIGSIYRNYSDRKRENQLIKIAYACKKRGYQLFVSNDIKLTYKVKADGIYIPSFNKNKIFSNLENKKIKIIGSAHNQKEIHKKIAQKCQIIFLSPLFYVKKNKYFLNIHKFNYLSRNNKINFYALGGISFDKISKLKLTAINGFGAISLFKKKPASERPVFIKNNSF
jgi:thiamine-phosphate pyrophosphorylase